MESVFGVRCSLTVVMVASETVVDALSDSRRDPDTILRIPPK